MSTLSGWVNLAHGLVAGPWVWVWVWLAVLVLAAVGAAVVTERPRY